MTSFTKNSNALEFAEEAGDVDQQVLGEKLELTWILPQPVEIPTTVIGTGQRHAPLDPPQQCAWLVKREIVRGLGMQKIDNLSQPIWGMTVRRQSLPPTVFGEYFGNLADRQHLVHGARHDRAPRHAVIFGVVRILHDDEPALLLNRLQSEAAIAARSRKDHADRAFAELFRQRAQEEVERQARAVTLRRLRESQGTAADREIGTRRNEIDMLALERHPVCCLLHRHRRMAGQQIDHHARVRRIEMLDQNECHAGGGREGRE